MLPFHPALSPFQQTLREQEEKFFQTFPDARTDHFQLSHTPQSWRQTFTDAHLLAGTGFQLSDIHTLHYDYSLPLPQPPSQSELTQAVDPSFIGHSVQAHHYATPYASPSYHDSFAISAPLESPVSTSDSDISPFARVHQLNQLPTPSPVMDSLPSPGSSSDPSSVHATYHSPQHHLSPPFDPLSSPPHHHDSSAPLSPPALVPAHPAPYPHSHEIPEPEHRSYFPPHNATPSIPPPRRREGSHRVRRTSPYARPPNHRSGGTRGTLPLPNPNMGWPTSPQNTAPSMGFSSNVAGAFVNMMSGSMADQTTDTITPLPIAGPSEGPPVSISGKRNPDKKPALACVFCRGRKIACGPPPKDGDGKTCNQCQRRSLRCEYPTESRRGMRKKPSPNSGTPPTTSSTPAAGTSKAGTSKAGKSDNATKDPKANPSAQATSKITTKKR